MGDVFLGPLRGLGSRYRRIPGLRPHTRAHDFEP